MIFKCRICNMYRNVLIRELFKSYEILGRLWWKIVVNFFEYDK